MRNKGTLYLIPNFIAAAPNLDVLSPSILKTLPGIKHFLAEDIRSVRRYFSSLRVFESIEPLSFSVLNKDTRADEIPGLMRPLMDGIPMGIVSESGCPGIADPGSVAVRFAHQHGIKVVPLVGPSSVVLALMASGLNGQQFAFNGYLPIGNDLAHSIRSYEKKSQADGQTQIFIETPYRNNAVFQALTKNLNPNTMLCIGFDITGEEEFIVTRSVAEWRRQEFQWPKKPAVFLFQAVFL